MCFVPRLHPTKGVSTFLEIANYFEEYSNFQFEVYGPDGGELQTVLKYIDQQKSSGRIKYLGSVEMERVQDILERSDLLVLPSTYDPYPMIVIEALFTGLPIVISKECGNASEVKRIASEFVVDGVEASFYIENILELANKDFMATKRQEIHDKAKDLFSIDSKWKTLKETYELALGLKS